ncbi:hypothetical protein BCR39DRAFT_514314 [Naematelia encephala]|uniref:NAD-dependent epimerase/dehydratase domain-containing protein n=1 Tax=Naematelia encephala TaxID=71784 RepID=A0A1Y2BIX9_9TREE|nr:hypothetical protein BCR39DRAFT_514314 [Naematelia encephala]
MSAVPSFTDTAALSERRLRDPQRGPEESKKRVLVTGGSGKLGRWVVREMVDHGYEVFNLDMIPPAPSEVDVKARFILVDLRDYGQVVSTIMDVDSGYKGVDAIIHLAAIPAPAKAPNHVVFHNNSLQTYNILEASRVTGVKHVALASSETVFGLPLYPHSPTKLPVTEEVERPESSYSLAKLMGEKMSEQYCRWDPKTKIINIRLSNVMSPDDYARFESWQDDPWERAWNGFCYIDARDCAQAFRLAIESSLTGFHVFNIANADIAYRKQTTAQLAKLVFPEVPYTPETDNPREGLISIKKAKEVLGFKPTHDWQSEAAKLKKA